MPDRRNSVNSERLRWMLEDNGYELLSLRGGKWCGVLRQYATWGLFVDLDMIGYQRRYCYETFDEACKALEAWDGTGHPGGPWIKVKGKYEGKGIDMLNPALGQEFE